MTPEDLFTFNTKVEKLADELGLPPGEFRTVLGFVVGICVRDIGVDNTEAYLRILIRGFDQISKTT